MKRDPPSDFDALKGGCDLGSHLPYHFPKVKLTLLKSFSISYLYSEANNHVSATLGLTECSESTEHKKKS